MRLGVAVSTFQRPDTLAQALDAWDRFLPSGATLVVVDDASNPPAVGATHRLDTNSGVAAVKNAGIAALMDAGCDHMWLVDDDCWPTVPDWWGRYVRDAVPHLMLCWGKARMTHRDHRYTHWGHPRGVSLYVERRVIDAIGGMRIEFGKWGSEHVEWSRRIHQAGFTPSPFMDLAGSRNWWHCEDWGRPGESNDQLAARRRETTTFPAAERSASYPHRAALMEKYDGVVEFVPYR